MEIPLAECRRLLAGAVFGRVALVVEPGRAEILPVNYVVSDDAVWLRTGPGTLLERYADGGDLALEVDHVDPTWGTGWSVVARGCAERRTEGPLTSAGRPAPGPPRWVRHPEQVWIRLAWTELTGRRLGAAPAASSSAVLRVRA
ncbi:MAG TPA: pyridoxamine 5'-phosphate oxidase family protein [Nocardioides sp.]|nr:pyridoxamine 5'-phosphate oxidase family protein [Nocardioides sp.]